MIITCNKLLAEKTFVIIVEMVKKEIKVSVLVPIYNVEKYLRQCLESVVSQTLEEIEIICLNDGSTDGSLEIIQEFQKKDPRIVLVDKKNSGYGDSMNLGLKKARGEYIGIVESDDYIDDDAFEKLYRYAKLYDVDVVRANYYFNKGGKDKKNLYIDPLNAGRVVDPARQTWIFYQAPAIWSAIYRREFLDKNGIEFLPTPGASYQDTGFNFKVWASTHRAFFTTEAFLHYRIDNEASSVNNPGKVMNIVYEYTEIEKFLREKGLFKELGPVMEIAKFGGYYWNILRLKTNLLPDFLKVVKDEYTKAREEGLLYKEYSTSEAQWKMMNYIIDHSVTSSVKYCRLQKAKIKLRDVAKEAWKKTHPSFQKQQEVAELITELNAEITSLEGVIKTLEDKE